MRVRNARRGVFFAKSAARSFVFPTSRNDPEERNDAETLWYICVILENMKKITAILISATLGVCLLMLLFSCGSSNDPGRTERPTSDTVTTADPGLDALEPSDFTEPAWDELDFSSMKPVSGEWNASGGTLSGANENSGDCFIMSDIRHDPGSTMSVSTDIHFKDGTACGIVFGVTDRSDPSAGWYCVNVDRDNFKNTRLFSVNTGTVGTASTAQRPLTEKEQFKKDFNLRIDIYPGGVFAFWLDGKFVASITDSDYRGGYIGLQTYYASVEFSNTKVRVIESENHLQELSVVGDAVLRPAFDRAVRCYFVNLPYKNDCLKLGIKPEENAEVYVNGMHYRSEIGRVTLPLSVGTNDFEILSVGSDGSVSVSRVIAVRYETDEAIYSDEYRPYAHFTVADAWLNDPNGLVYDEKTETWHMFLQYTPGSTESGIKYWAHTVSKDLFHWSREEIAIAPDSDGAIWSGSCVVDRNNTSGFFDDSVDPRQRFVAIYTVRSDWGSQRQHIAYSLDGGFNWIKYENNPVIASSDFGIVDFRDPKVMWIEDPDEPAGGIWLMIVAGGRAQIFTSHDLKDWTFNSALNYKDGSEIYTECPDLIPMPLDGDRNNIKWVFIGGGDYYVVGDLKKDTEGKYVFTAERDRYDGFVIGDGYATQSYYNDPKGRTVIFAWVRDFTAQSTEGKGWNGMMSVPYETKLVSEGKDYKLTAVPVEELSVLEGEEVLRVENEKNCQSDLLRGVTGNACVIDAKINTANAEEIAFVFRDRAYLIYDVSKKRLTLTTTVGSARTYLPYADDEITLKIVVDNGVIEVFANDGTGALCLKNFSRRTELSYSLEITGSVGIGYLSVKELDSYHRS